MDYKHLIEKRQSYREYTDKQIGEQELHEIENYFSKALKFKDDITLQLFTGNTGAKLEGVVGYHGYAFNAPAYIVITGTKEKDSYISAGFTGMDIVLKLTEMGIDTCFLTVEDGDLPKKVLKIEGENTVLSIIACGYAKKIKDMKRLDIKSPSQVNFTKRKGYFAPKISIHDMVFDGKWGNNQEFNEYTPGEIIEDALFAASLAPYFFNKQNYRFVLTNNHIILCDKLDESISVEDRLIGMGCAMLNFYAVYSNRNHDAKMWISEKPKVDIEIPSEYEIIAYINR